MGFALDDLTYDLFLGGALTILQPKTGYRAGVDPVLMAATVPAISGESVLELGCGAGVASLCLASRVPGLTLSGVELQADYIDLARRNADSNGIEMDLHQADLSHLPVALLQQNFDHVIANPPYYLRSNGRAATDAGRELALGEVTPLAEWIDVATRRLKPRGHLTIIQDAERLPALMAALDGRLGAVKLLPLAPRIGRPAHLVILHARKGARAAAQLLAPIVMHEGAAHDFDRDSYTDQIRAVLRSGANLAMSAVNKK
ncbi:methyltransferase [Marinosulfonomonas sp. PRT-SC04]|nr:methyltransferase [Marinosulfonomonas sp. PRT-SC04]